jgi:hypothetical protein
VRNLFLILLLANILLFAWNRWVLPLTPGVASRPDAGLALYREGDDVPRPARSPPAPQVSEPPPTQAPRGAPMPEAAACIQIGPLPAAEAATELARSLGEQQIAATPVARDTQAWVGNWIQIGGFATQAAAAEARGRLVAAGLTDAFLMQEGADTLISLGVFREKERADRVAGLARSLGYRPVTTSRYRPAVEYWLVARLPAGTVDAGDDLRLPRPGILRVEPIECPADADPPETAVAGAGGSETPGGESSGAADPGQP